MRAVIRWQSPAPMRVSLCLPGRARQSLIRLAIASRRCSNKKSNSNSKHNHAVAEGRIGPITTHQRVARTEITTERLEIHRDTRAMPAESMRTGAACYQHAVSVTAVNSSHTNWRSSALEDSFDIDTLPESELTPKGEIIGRARCMLRIVCVHLSNSIKRGGRDGRAGATIHATAGDCGAMLIVSHARCA
jgi:hypothetical protein